MYADGSIQKEIWIPILRYYEANYELDIFYIQAKEILLSQLRYNLVHWSQWYETYTHLNFAIFFMRISFNLKIIQFINSVTLISTDKQTKNLKICLKLVL